MYIFRKIFLLLLFYLCLLHSAFSQKVGVVLSGGGASGLSHIGVLKALEENNIPIDYIDGASMGSFVGAMYAIGLSPEQMEDIVLSEEFQNWAYGNIDKKYICYFKKSDVDASWVTLKLSFDSTFETNLPTNFISPASIDFALMKILAPANAASNYNFDSLLIPFRCVASDIESKKSVVFQDGDLGEAVRASLSYPFYLQPIKVNGKLLFDGGLYNNFPSNIMYDQKYPDIIIGSNVSSKVTPPDEDNLISQIKSMIINRVDYTIPCQNGILIEPQVNSSTFDFTSPQAQIDSGYAAAMRQMPIIKSRITRRSDSTELADKRKNFIDKEPKLIFKGIYIDGLKRDQAHYVRNVLHKKGKTISLEKLAPAYFRLVQDKKIKNIYPTAKFNQADGNYDLFLKMKKEKNIAAEVGGDISNRPISEIFAAFEYKYLGNIGISTMANGYFGKLYSSAQAKMRFDFPFTVPFYIEPEITFNRWDYFKSSDLFFEDVKPAYLIQNDQHAYLNFAMPFGNKDKFEIGGGIASTADNYYQTDQFTQKDTADRTTFDMLTSQIKYERNTLNRKEYATQGTLISIKARYFNGYEDTKLGSTSAIKSETQSFHDWMQYKFVLENYYKQRGTLRMGIYAEGVYSNQPLFSNYTASILASPAFQPLDECKTLFQPELRAHTYFAFGLRNIITFRNKIDLRLEGYYYQPYQQIENNSTDNTAYYSVPFLRRYLIGSVALVGHTPVGPISVSVNYYYEETHPFSFLFHFGYIIFNNKSSD